MTLEDLNGYSVHRTVGGMFVDGVDRFTVYRHTPFAASTQVLQMATIGPLEALGGKSGFVWSRVHLMWEFTAADFVTPEYLG